MAGSSCTTRPRWSATSISPREPTERSRRQPTGRQKRAPRRAATELSAGGVVVRGEEVAVIVPVKRDARGRRVLGLPKGHPEAGEAPEQAAAREVREEAGVVAELVEPLGEVAYTYERAGRRIAKRVLFFLFEYRSGDVADHDHEIEEARWIPLLDAVRELSFAGEREMVSRVLSRRSSDL